MKKLLLILGVFTVLLGCRKDNAANVNLVGSWEYTGRVCYCFPPADSLDNKPGNGRIITFTRDTYKRYLKGVLQQSGSYITLTDKLNNQPVTRIIYDNDTTSAKVFFKIEGKKLTLYGEVPVAADGVEEYYEKQ